MILCKNNKIRSLKLNIFTKYYFSVVLNDMSTLYNLLMIKVMVLLSILKIFNLNFAQMAIKFCEIQPFVTSVIIGATTLEQLKTNVDSVDINLDKELIKKIGEIQKKYPNPCP